MPDFAAAVAERTPILTDGAIETRVMFETDYEMEPNVQVAAMVSDPPGRRILHDVYAGYVAAAAEHDLPVVIGTPTFRASANFVRRAGLDDELVGKLNADAVELLRQVRVESGHPPVFIAGVIGPSGDAYTPAEALRADAACVYHRVQAQALASAGVDYLFAPTFPALREALGACAAMAETGLPYVVSFVLGHEGKLLDGVPLADAVSRIDAEVDPPPLFHSISCVHPSIAAKALGQVRAQVPELLPRVAELKANGSALPTAELVQLEHPQADAPEELAEEIWSLHEPDGLHVLGGCCGTTDAHMRALAGRMAEAA